MPATPAVVGEGKPVTRNCRVAAGLTVIPDWVPEAVPSEALIDCVPAVFSVAAEAAGAVGQGRAGGKRRLAVRAAEVHRGVVVGGEIAVGVEGGDSERARRRPRPPSCGSRRRRACWPPPG